MPLTAYNEFMQKVGSPLGEGELLWTLRYQIRSGFNNDTNPLVAGRGITFSPNSDRIGDSTALIYPGAGSKIRGIVYVPKNVEAVPGVNLDARGVLTYPPKTVGVNLQASNYFVGYVVEGVIGVRVEQAVTPDTPVFCRISGTIDQIGTFRGDATNAVAMTNGEFLKSAAIGEVVPLYIKNILV